MVFRGGKVQIIFLAFSILVACQLSTVVGDVNGGTNCAGIHFLEV